MKKIPFTLVTCILLFLNKTTINVHGSVSHIVLISGNCVLIGDKNKIIAFQVNLL